MMSLKKVKIRRERASFPALILAFLIFSIVFFLSTVSVREEKPVSNRIAGKTHVQREFEISDINLCLISLFESESPEEVRIFSARNMPRGAAGYLYQADGQWHSIGNMYFSHEEAEKMNAYLIQCGMKAEMISVHQAGVTLRVTADEETLNTLHFCLSTFSEFEKELMDLSARLDAGALSEREARVLLSVMKYDLSKHEASAKAKTNLSGENAAKDILEMYLANLNAASDLTKSTGGELMLSARIRHAAIESAHKRVLLLKSLAD